ncbi:hypothetical protein BAY61_18310 [Prauserella marina]|nr:hypothetical protein BAY61_18310 [Prauserella marina]
MIDSRSIWNGAVVGSAGNLEGEVLFEGVDDVFDEREMGLKFPEDAEFVRSGPLPRGPVRPAQFRT